MAGSGGDVDRRGEGTDASVAQGRGSGRRRAGRAELWGFASGGSCLSGPAITDGKVFWGSGYSNLGFGTPNKKLFAFGLPWVDAPDRADRIHNSVERT
jgi:hypothetical protein